MAVDFIGGGNRRTRRKTLTCRKSRIIIMLFTSRFKLTTSVVIDTDCIGSCKFNYHTSINHICIYSIDIHYFLFIKGQQIIFLLFKDCIITKYFFYFSPNITPCMRTFLTRVALTWLTWSNNKVCQRCVLICFSLKYSNNFQHLSKTKQYACSAIICLYLLIAFHSPLE